LLVSGPDLLVVQGDTSSALGAALGSFAAGVPVAHVEAGLRTYDKSLPWPEEEYRTAIDTKAALLFAPTRARRRQSGERADKRRGPRHRQYRNRCLGCGRTGLAGPQGPWPPAFR
jgi:UDP-N-acetylglucosamine 2-epimerase (non-hydrolysing)